MTNPPAVFTDIFLAKDDSASGARLGRIARDAFGNEYIFVQGVNSQAAGQFATWSSTYVSTLCVTSTAATGPVGIAVAAGPATGTFYCWILIRGEYATAAVATNSNGQAALYISSTAGRLTTTAAQALNLTGAMQRANAVSNVAAVVMYYAMANGDTGNGA